MRNKSVRFTFKSSVGGIRSIHNGEVVLSAHSSITCSVQVAYLDGVVYHHRAEQAVNSFRYRVRYSIILLDNPPSGFVGGTLACLKSSAFIAICLSRMPKQIT